ncbi:hypothetical protein BREVNS_0687 [Brevinematales bacterium NS]|nr:hypothetical protein BREVNS_0687 [Brevinematales bacterium NS]
MGIGHKFGGRDLFSSKMRPLQGCFLAFLGQGLPAPFEIPAPLHRLQKDPVLVACYACASDGRQAAFAGHGRTFPLRRASPSSVGDLNSSS